MLKLLDYQKELVCHNLLSISQLYDGGHSVMFDSKLCKIIEKETQRIKFS